MTPLDSCTPGKWAKRSRTVSAPIFRTTTISYCPLHRDGTSQNVTLRFSSTIRKVTRLAWTLHITKCWPKLHGPASAPTDLFLRVVLLSCMRQRTADVDYYLPWNHYLLTCLRYVLEAACLVGERAVTFNPRFPYFLSPDSSDSVLGSLLCWSSESALLLLDSFMPLLREATIQQACEQTHEVWILRQDRPPHYAAADLQLIRGKFARLVAVIPLISLVLHSPSCWLVRRETG